MDERLRWLETRISSSLRPRNEELKNLFLNDDNRLAFYEFINNEDIKKLFVYVRPMRQFTAALQPPNDLKSKSIFFLKCNPGTKLTKDNMDQEVFYMDCTNVPLEHLELTIREVYLPLLGTNQPSVMEAGINGDKIMDILHRLMAAVEVTQGHVRGQIVLNLPSIEVLAEAAASPNRRGAVLHVLESTVINWIKQIRVVLKHDPTADLQNQFGTEPGPLEEMKMWENHLDRLHSVNTQLDSEMSLDILHNLEQANSQYAHSFSSVRKEINKAVAETNKILKFLGTMRPWFDRLHIATEPRQMLVLFKPLMTVLKLVWTSSTYYHQIDKFHNLLRLLSNEVVHRAIAMVGEDILREPLESYTKLKEALRVCAAFRGTYLDFKDTADDQNAQNIAENAERLAARPQGALFTTKMYGPHAYTPRYGLRNSDSHSSTASLHEEDLWNDSPWPPRNAPCFDLLNSFMERCNDVLELVETTRHFRLLAGAAEVGGAGSMSLDAMVKEIHQKYTHAMQEFFSVVDNVLNIDGSQLFERSFFKFRTVVKSLEKRLAGILRQAFCQCPTVEAQLRLLEVFEGVSSRELVQAHLRDKDEQLVRAFTAELQQVRTMFNENAISPPSHYNMPPVVSRLMWVVALRERIRVPWEKLRHVSPHSVEGNGNMQMRETYNDCIQELEAYEGKLVTDWQNNITSELTLRLKQPLLIAEEYDEDLDTRPQIVHVNLDPQLLLLLREIHYLANEPFNIHLPSAAKELIRNTNSFELSVTATRLETIVSKYNTIMRTIGTFEKPLFERKLDKIDSLFEQGLQQYTWKMKESADFIETAMALVCMDVHQNLDVVQTNCHEIAEITISWSTSTLDVFKAREAHLSYSMEDLLDMQRHLTDDHESLVVPSGNKIHQLVQVSFQAVQISQASPAWQDYIDYIDAIILDGLKQATLSSLRSMLNTLVQANIAEDNEDMSIIPVLTIRLELIENGVAFRPPLDQNTSVISVQELVQRWLEGFLARGKLVSMLGPKGSYEDYIAADDEVKQLLMNINQMVEENSEECKKLLEVFRDYAFLWLQDVNQTFEDFLRGNLSPNPLRSANRPMTTEIRQQAVERTSLHSRASSAKSSIDSAGLMGTAERTFLTPKGNKEGDNHNIPSLDEFDNEIDIYKSARDEVQSLQNYHNVGWLRVDLQPIKQVLTTYASKWMWTFTKYLSDQVTQMLEKLDVFLKRIEPEIESITGEERDTASFMKMMRLFNEVSAQQSEMDGKFTAMHRTVLLLRKYGQVLPEKTQFLFSAAPGRWNNLKTKVSLAKQRLGPRIQEESARITQDLEAFAYRVMDLSNDLDKSDIYNRDCSLGDAWVVIDNFVKRLTVLENEAQDLIELQELLEASVVNFSVLPQCRYELNNLKQVWETVRVIDEQQSEWKRHRWQKMNTKFLKEETSKQLDIVRALPEDVFTWDVYMGLHESITTIQACLPLIDDLSSSAMRTRHWKQLVRVTGGALTIDNDTLKRMTLGELLSLGLQKHVDDVRAIVQRAVKDLSIEQSLKTYEEVWLSKIFELRSHVRSKTTSSASDVPDNQSEYGQSDAGQTQQLLPGNSQPSRSQARTTSRISNQSSHSRKRNSVCSLPASLLNMGEDTGLLYLLTTTEPIFDELECHQVSLQAMQSNSAAGSFLDEVLKWQKRLQTIEAVLTTWLEVQEKWVELEEIFSSTDVRTSLSHDANRFSVVNKDFRLLMRATEKNPNVLQCCSRKNILNILEHMNHSLETCRKSLLNHLERRRQIFPRFYFLSMEDVLHIVCNGYDLSQVNLYISKLFENVGSLVYDTQEENDRCSFTITGVESTLGERLELIQPVNCDGQIETWLTALISGIKSTLQYQLATSLGVEKPLKTKRIRSAGARKVPLPIQSSTTNTKTSKDPPGSRQSSRQGKKEDAGVTPSAGELFADLDPLEEGSRSWTLDHVSEVVYLATQIQMTKQIAESVDGLEAGNAEALRDALDKIDTSIAATTMLLKGLEGEKEASQRRDKEKLNSDAQSMKDMITEREQDLLSESQGRRSAAQASKKGSTLDIAGDKSPIMEEEEEEDVLTTGDAESVQEANTMQPLDTMNILVPEEKKESVVVVETVVEEDDKTEVKLMLFPSQIQKLTCLLALLAHLRDLIHRLMELAATQAPATTFDWKCQMMYNFKEDTKAVTIQCMDAGFEYGFEYIGASSREVITPLTERVFVSLTQAIKSHHGALCVGPIESGKFEIVCELSRCLGHVMYVFNCTPSVDYSQLQDIFRGMASTGAWVCFNKMNQIQPAALSVFSQLMSVVMGALRASKAVVHHQSEDIQLSPHGACFGFMSSEVPVLPRDPDKMLLYTSAVATLPDTILRQFRVVSVAKPDLRLALEVMLFSQGFLHGRELARKTTHLHHMCCQIFGTNTFINDKITMGSDRSASFHGWSLHTMKGVTSEAGAFLEKTAQQTDSRSQGFGDTFRREGLEKHEHETQEKGVEPVILNSCSSQLDEKLQLEEEALVMALRNTFMPRMQTRDASVLATLLSDLWPDVTIPMVFGGDSQVFHQHNDSLFTIRSDLRLRTARSHDSQKSLKDSLNLNTPVVALAHADRFSALLDQDAKEVMDNMQDAIAVATEDLGLLPGAAFQARVVQLAQLNDAHQTIIVAGPPGCGKSECIKTFAVAERELGKMISIQTVFTKAVESQELMGYLHPKTRDWKEGLLTTLLRKFCIQPASMNYDVHCKPIMKIMQLDGQTDPSQMEMLQNCLIHNGSVVLANNERIVIPDTLRFIWEQESLEHLSPSLLANVGVVCMNTSDVGWKLMLVQWLEHRSEADRDLLSSLCNSYIEKVLMFVTECTQPPMFGQKKTTGHLTYKRVVQHTPENMVHTFCNLLESLVNPYPDLSDVEYERYFNFACVWSFGGTLSLEHRESFSQWWKEHFESYIDYPEEGTVFDYLVDSETHEFCRWSDIVPSYTGTPHEGIPADAFVHTVHIEQLLHLLGLLSDAGKPVMLVGENGCGKTSIINERIRTVCSGEVAEVLSLTVYANRFMNARLLYERLDDRLEWKHGRTYVPKGNKRLLCLVDDLNLSQVDKYGFQTATELVREHLDDGGFYCPTSHAWHYVKNVTYVTSINPQTTASLPKLSQRLLRHFAIFGCPYPGSTELQTIFTTLLHTHFVTPDSIVSSSHHGSSIHDVKSTRLEDTVKSCVSLIVKVTVELQDRLRTMFLPTAPRCHYIFTTRDLSTIFRNICLSQQPDSSRKHILHLWQHECFWIYGRRMVNDVDFRRFKQAFTTAVRKQFTNEEQIQLVTSINPPMFSNLIEQDSGIVTAGRTDSRHSASVSDKDAKTDLYKPMSSLQEVKELMERGVEEYNKIHPRIKLALYKTVIEQVCRLARTIASPHEGANTVLVSEGCPGRCTIIVKLAANLCNYTIYQINPSPLSGASEYKMEQFKADLVHGYTRAGAKGENILLLLHEEELLDEDFIVFLIEFIVSGSITHLFSYEEQTTIINSIRTEVTQAGLTYTRDVAWNFFLRTVRNNFRVCLIAGRGGQKFQHRCREYPAFTKNMNLIWFPHWSKSQLVQHAFYHLAGVAWMSDVQRENIAHMLASMHLVLRQQDGQERDSGEYSHITNTSYEKFVERFISLTCSRHSDVNEVQMAVTKTLQQIRRENEVAIKLKKQLEHEMVVLTERKAGTIKILSQIGQDTAITEQQIKVVKNQLEKIHKLKKLLPEYQVAHERAVYKAIAIVADTKKVVQNMNIEKLAELRAMSKPIIDIEDLMATIIMILKSPSADLTWQKGAKRQMANLERFIEELMSFDDTQLPEATLCLVEPYLKKASFDPDNLERKAANSACGSLCKWVRGVVKYHRMMLSKVKPLHAKVDETTQAVDSAEHKMNTLESKRKALEIRLADLARGFEEATIDKNEQEEKTVKMKKMLDTAAQLRKILKGERQRGQQIYDSHTRRLVAIPGGCGMSAAFATYLGPYHHNFRRVMLTVHWPNCLRERGVPLVIDSIDGLRGRVIDWSINFLKTASGASSIYEADYMSVIQGEQDIPDDIDDREKEGEEDAGGKKKEEREQEVSKAEELGESGESPPATPKAPGTPKSTAKPSDQKDGTLDERPKTSGEADTGDVPADGGDPMLGAGGLERIAEEDDDEYGSQYSDSTAPVLTTMQYNKYVRSLIKLLIGEPTLNDWIRKDFGPRQVENAAMLSTSWQRPPMMIDPNGEGSLWLGRLNKLMNKHKLISLDMETRWTDPQVILTLEKAITRGKPVLLRNCEEHIDNIITPLIHHRNTARENNNDEEPRMIMFCGRRILCHQNFRFYLSTPLPKPKFDPDIASTTCLLNFGISHDTLIEDLLMRAFARIRPELYRERVIALRNLQLMKDTLYRLSETVKERVLAGGQEAMISSPKALQFITDLTEAKMKLARKLADTQSLLDDLELLKDELFPLARRAAMMFSVLQSLPSVHKEYQFTLQYFIELFDEAVGGELPKDFGQDPDAEDGYELDGESSVEVDKRPRVGSTSSQVSNTEKTATDKPTDSGKEDTVATTGEGEEAKQESGHAEGTTEESTASTGAAQKFVEGSESDDLPPLELPDTVPLPSEGVEYTALSVNRVKQLMDILTSLVYHRVKLSLYEEDCLLFATLACLNIQNEGGEVFSNEEMSLLLQGNPGLGMQLTLSDFDCSDEPPQWMPREKWEDILALSVLPGPLDSLCVDFAQNSAAWKIWYKSTYPEREALPCANIAQDTEMPPPESGRAGSRGSERAAAAGSPDLGLLSEFHQLLILRMLRPDRLPAALARYVEKNLNLTLPKETGFNLGDVLLDARSHLGVLLLLPPSPSHLHSCSVSRLRLTHSPVTMLTDLAKSHSVSVEMVKMCDGCEIEVDEAIDTAEKQDGWVIIEDLHLAPTTFYKELKRRLLRLYKSRASIPADQQDKSRFCVWVTSEPCEHIPHFLLQNLHKVAWNHMISPGADDTGDHILPSLHHISPEGYLKSAIVNTLQKIPADVWEKVRQENQMVRSLVYGIAVIQGVLVARQLFGSLGLSQWYPFDTVEISCAVSMVTGTLLRKKDETEPGLEELCFGLSKLLYGMMVLDESDQMYIDNLCSHVLGQVYREPAGEILLGTVLLPTPPANVDPTEYGDWFERVGDDTMTMPALQLGAGVEKERCEASASTFINHLDLMFETQNSEAGDISTSSNSTVNIAKLRSALDICLEELPPLLELGQVPLTLTQDYNFPYHCPSIISLSSISSSLMPESIGYVLLQECLWLNSILCHIRQQISDLQSCLLGGPEALPQSHLSTVYSLQEEHVPVSWIHPNCQPCTHSLVSWFADKKKRYQQLQSWVRRGMVPTFKDNGQLQDNPTIACGQLSTVWLGGLVNPMSLLSAYRQEKAIVCKCDIDQIVFECDVLNTTDTEDIEMEDGLFLINTHLQGAGWNFDKDMLRESRRALFEVPCLYVKLMKKPTPQPAEREGDGDMEELNENIYHCPVYMNRSRQMLVTHLPIKCPSPVERWGLSRTALILDPGLPEDGTKKSRSYLLLQRLPLSQRGEGEEMGEEEDLEEQTQQPDTAHTEAASVKSRSNQSVKSQQSSQSQLSYRPMSPKADPLPLGLGLTRERPMVRDDAPDAAPKHSSSRPPSKPSSANSNKSFNRRPVSRGSGISAGSRGTEGRKSSGRSQGMDGGQAKDSAHLRELDKRGKEPTEEQLDRQSEDQRGSDKAGSTGNVIRASQERRPSQKSVISGGRKVSETSQKSSVQTTGSIASRQASPASLGQTSGNRPPSNQSRTSGQRADGNTQRRSSNTSQISAQRTDGTRPPSNTSRTSQGRRISETGSQRRNLNKTNNADDEDRVGVNDGSAVEVDVERVASSTSLKSTDAQPQMVQEIHDESDLARGSEIEDADMVGRREAKPQY
ncbi:uncharacterized protein [Haliotis cracherodii]|uniref:uncharacterized protein n=1 Tax=Haliotis cracherodii TaxID=6455 RepID=UPI0039EBF9F1